MSEIRYVVLSDLHFGAENSVLTSLRPSSDAPGGFVTDERAPSPVLAGLLEGLRSLTADQTKRPTLVLAGDVLDLALSPDQVAATVFGGFASLAFREDAGGQALFDPLVYYLPGNHDHHLWETAREAQYTAYVETVPATDDLVAPWHTTAMEPDDELPLVRSHFLASLIRRQPGCEAVDVRVMYPNLAVIGDDGGRGLVVSHGHFIEPIYTLMSHLKDVLYPGQRTTGLDDIDVWESENFAWIDFFWSTLGRSGQVGTDVGLVYAGLASPEVLDVLVTNLARGAPDPRTGKGPREWLHPLERDVAIKLLKREVAHRIRSERGKPQVAISESGIAGLTRYLAQPVLTQLRGEVGRVPDDVTFVFGHTHKPFVDRLDVEGYAGPVRILNTGGWVVDTDVARPVQAGVVVLVDDDLNCAPVEIYRQSADGAPTPVQVLPAADGDTGDNPLRTWLTSVLDPASEPWRGLSACAAELVTQRHTLETRLLAYRPS